MTVIEVSDVPYWNPFTAAVLIATCIILSIIWVRYVRRHRPRRDTEASVVGTVAILLIALVLPLVTWVGVSNSEQSSDIEQGLRELGYENITHSFVDFTASLDGQYVEGKLVKLPGQPDKLQVKRYEYVE